MTLPAKFDRCCNDECCCKCTAFFELKSFNALNKVPVNHGYACSFAADEGIMTSSESGHGLCECFTREGK